MEVKNARSETSGRFLLGGFFLSLGMDAYSDSSLNLSYDAVGQTEHNHIYSTPYTATSPVFTGVPAGTYVAFEDLQLQAPISTTTTRVLCLLT